MSYSANCDISELLTIETLMSFLMTSSSVGVSDYGVTGHSSSTPEFCDSNYSGPSSFSGFGYGRGFNMTRK